MKATNVLNTKQNLLQLVSEDNKGEEIVLLSQFDWKEIGENEYLNSIPGFVESIIEAEEQYNPDCTIYKKDEEW